MVHIKADNSNQAWRKTFMKLYKEGRVTDNDKYFRDEVVLIEIKYASLVEPDDLFPMKKKELRLINRYICSGKDEDRVSHAWTKIYYHRIFDKPFSQIDFIIRKLKGSEVKGETQISIWDKSIDQKADISPCTQILWARIKHGKLEWHTHAHSSDAYKKLLLNLQEFISLQNYVAKKVDVKVGKYIHFFDSCHMYKKDMTEIKRLYDKMKKDI